MCNQAEICHKIRSIWAVRIKFNGELLQVAEDIWITDKCIAEHTDTTAPGLITYGLVLLNELGLELCYRGQRTALSRGSSYRINGREPHSAEQPDASTEGLFAALIWDMPPETTIDYFNREAKLRVAQWVK